MNLETGDILLFQHNQNYKSCYNCFFSLFTGCIKCCTDSKYSHAAIVVKDPDFRDFKRKGLFILESSFEAFPDAVDHKYKLGVELEEFDKVLRDARRHGEVYYRKLSCVRNNEFYTKLSETYDLVKNKPYDCLPKDWISALLHRTTGDEAQSARHFWCSALVAFIYVKWGFLDQTVPWSYITPKMLGTEKNEFPLKYINCTVSPETLLEI